MSWLKSKTKTRSGKNSRSPETVLYLYGISKEAGEIPEVEGVDAKAQVQAIASASLISWVSLVSKSEFADNLVKNMESLDWLAAVSVRHQRVVSALSEKRALLPARFGTVFLSESSLKQHIAERKASLQSDLKRIQEADEWGVKVFGELPQKSVAAQTPHSGREYLSAKAAVLQARSANAADGEIVGFVEALKQLAQELSPGGAVSSGQRGLLWHGSILLRRTDRKKLERLLARFSREWEDQRRIECTGPWPPYSFVTREAQA